MKETKWWQQAVGYQIYPRSFNDSNNDGIGDLPGIMEKIPYLKKLGVDFLWLNPIFVSPNVDNGYDISDYQGIAPEFGTMEDFDKLLDQAHQADLKIIMDLVVNHTSDQHPWFLQAKLSRDNPYHDYYIWHDGKKDTPPNDWPSIFGGSVWEYNEECGQYYFHTFAKEQPDLNWDSPKLRQDILEMITWWLDKGIDGYRVDAISHLKKADFTLPQGNDNARPFAHFQNVAGIEDYLNELKNVFAKYDLLTVGEASGVSAGQAPSWVGPDGYFKMIFEFDHINLWQKTEQKINIPGFKKALSTWQNGLSHGQGWNALYMENHDVPRSISLFDVPEDLEVTAGKAIAMMYFCLQGTPFIYQGQELGMTNFPFTKIEQIETQNSHYQYQELLAQGLTKKEAMVVIQSTTRDNARTPMQWDDSKNAGFSEVNSRLAVNPNYKKINATAQIDQPDSLFSFYQKLIQLRKNHPVLITGEFLELLPDHQQMFVYKRLGETKEFADFLVLVNLTDEVARFNLPEQKEAQLILSNYTVENSLTNSEIFQPFEARLYQVASEK
ncbi:alpha-glucosidase [Enterococcus timonensis]|uniref:alpha-glucosidase n=1 Tax=Enterococcus timonensis TaxID=1852364 RepID=UPI0008D900A2|nr:alpha-glucosidase [Enterococcus timonensis]